MKLSRKSDYAVRAVRHLACLPKGKLGSINSVSEAENIPREFLAKILKDLTLGGILTSFQGVTGGYRLSRMPREVNFLQVIEAIDGPIYLNLCTRGPDCGCENYETCQAKYFWLAQEKAFKKALGREHFAKYKKARK